jgi:hypothetical protein
MPIDPDSRDSGLAAANARAAPSEPTSHFTTRWPDAIQASCGDNQHFVEPLYKIFSSCNFLTSSAPASDSFLKKTPGWPSGAAIRIHSPLLA